MFEVLDHPLIKGFSPEGDVEFYSFDEAVCRHERWRSRCREIHGMLISLSTSAESQRATVIRDILANWGIDPSVQTPDQFCGPPWMQTGTKPPRLRSAERGRPPDARRRRLLNAIVPALTANGRMIRGGGGFQTRFENTLIVTAEQLRLLEEAGFVAAGPSGKKTSMARGKTKP